MALAVKKALMRQSWFVAVLPSVSGCPELASCERPPGNQCNGDQHSPGQQFEWVRICRAGDAVPDQVGPGEKANECDRYSRVFEHAPRFRPSFVFSRA